MSTGAVGVVEATVLPNNQHRIETETEKKNTMLAWWCSTRVKRPAAECYAETLQKGCPEICPRIALSQGHPLVNDWSDRLRSATM
ncbi:uncharacterized protein LOC120421016 isoform X3 [Culex pipiens pallens]|uniref:uncharacterized protein LOC120421016 isoform X3 n=1 Tax=Culex pipiens pallens TaxID=42434 RepID=UPI00195301F3|nr:uncharacterized protein LOC120421016 isoform X3 [Culex pipiens pallens]